MHGMLTVVNKNFFPLLHDIFSLRSSFLRKLIRYDETDNEFDSEEQITTIWIEEMAFRVTNFIRMCVRKRAQMRGEEKLMVSKKSDVLVRVRRMAVQASLSFWLSNHNENGLTDRAIQQMAAKSEAAKAGGAMNSAKAFARVMVRSGLLFEG